MRAAFPDDLVALRQRLPHAVRALEADLPGAYGFVTVHDHADVSVRCAALDRADSSRDRGIVLRLFVGGRNFEWATDDLRPDRVEAGVAELRARVLARLGPPPWAGPVAAPVPWSEERRDDLHPLIRDAIPADAGPDTPVHFGAPLAGPLPDLDALLAVARDAKAAVIARAEAAGHGLRTASASARCSVSTTIFVDRARTMSQTLPQTSLTVLGFSALGRPAYARVAGLGGLEAAVLTDEALEQAATMGARLDAAERLTPGRYDVITGPEVTGVIAHEAFGHTQEGDTRALGRSCATRLEQEGATFGACTIVSNPAVFDHEGSAFGTGGSYFFDHEGVLARPVVILDQGRLGAPMNDLRSALVGDGGPRRPRTSNARRESWRRPLYARQNNTYFPPGDATLDDLVGRVAYGFLARHVTSGMEDPKGMALTAGIGWFEEIRDGRRTGRLFVGPQGGQIELSDPVPRVLASFRGATATDREIPETLSSGCQKYHKEYVDAGVGGPYVLWEGLRCG